MLNYYLSVNRSPVILKDFVRQSLHIPRAYAQLTGFILVGSSKASHTRTVVRECFKGDEASQWKMPKFDTSPHQNPLTDLHENWQA